MRNSQQGAQQSAPAQQQTLAATGSTSNNNSYQAVGQPTPTPSSATVASYTPSTSTPSATTQEDTGIFPTADCSFASVMFNSQHCTQQAQVALGSVKFDMLMDSGATQHFLESNLIPGLDEFFTEYKVLEPPQPITTAGLYTVYGVATALVYVTVRDDQNRFRRIRMPVIIAPGLGSHLCGLF